MATIVNCSLIPLNEQPAGTVPDVSGALQDRYQQMVFETVVKTTVGFQVVETGTQINFVGNIQPFTERQLLIKPEGQRAWSWYWLQSITPIDLKVDQIVTWRGNNYRIMAKKNLSIYGYYEWQMIQDYTGSNPST